MFTSTFRRVKVVLTIWYRRVILVFEAKKRKCNIPENRSISFAVLFLTKFPSMLNLSQVLNRKINLGRSSWRTDCVFLQLQMVKKKYFPTHLDSYRKAQKVWWWNIFWVISCSSEIFKYLNQRYFILPVWSKTHNGGLEYWILNCNFA